MALSAAQTWPASVELDLRSEAGRTRLARCSHNGPLYVQRPFYPEGREHPHLYLLHPPGGIVSGDCLDIAVDVAANSGALVTTPGATRVYRARDDNPLQRQRCRLRLGKDAILEWFPMETIVFDGAWVELETTVELTRNSCFVGWEVSCFGLPASRQPFRSGRFSQRYRELDLVFVESGGDNLSATFSPELSDLTLYVIDVSAGDKIPRKGGPGITRSDLLIINKTDLAPSVGASLDVMDRDTRRMRKDRPFVFSNLKTGDGLDAIIRFIVTEGMLPERNIDDSRDI